MASMCIWIWEIIWTRVIRGDRSSILFKVKWNGDMENKSEKNGQGGTQKEENKR